MAKGIIVVEMPTEGCRNCSVGKNMSNPFEECVICRLAPKGVNSCRIDAELNEKPDWCPICPIPQRKEVMGYGNYSLLDFERRGRQTGWNDCVDYLEGRNGK